MKLAVTIIGIGIVIAGSQLVYSGQNNHSQTLATQHRTSESSDRGMGMGSCCFTDDGTCEDGLDEMDCKDQGGTYMWESCDAGFCNPACPDAGIFANVAQPLEFTCGDLSGYDGPPGGGGGGVVEISYIDLNADGAPEQVAGIAYVSAHSGGFKNYQARLFSKGEAVGTFGFATLLDIHPDNLTYSDITFGSDYIISGWGYLEVTGDGLVDAILRVENYPEPIQFYYVENISTTNGIACASDSNSDGVVDVTDLLAVVSDWGVCPE